MVDDPPARCRQQNDRRLVGVGGGPLTAGAGMAVGGVVGDGSGNPGVGGGGGFTGVGGGVSFWGRGAG
ncbi:MAG TPA: hypothetical protein PKH77_26425 [Anaerolineae bacterium]|nr:hypothetical protein [Anaerolineae bacterium]